MLRKAGVLGGRVCTLCAACFCAVILIQNLAAVLSGERLFVLFAAAAALAFGAVCLHFLRSSRRFPAILFAVRFLLALTFILWLNSQPVQDFKTMYDAALQLAEGSHAYLDKLYFFNWAYQSAFVAYEAVVIRLFGASLLPLQLLNAAYLAGTNVLVYRIARRFLPEKAAMTVGILYAVYPAPLFLAGVLTNQHLAAFLLYAAVDLLLGGKKNAPGRAVAAGALMALGNAMRPVGVILLLAALVWCALRALRHGDRSAWLSGLSLALAYFVAGAALSALIVSSGINPQGLKNNQPMWKFVVGLNQQSNGQWNEADYDAFLSLPTEQADAAMRRAVRERLGIGAEQLAGLAWRKSAAMWAGSEDLYWGFWHLTNADPAPLSLSWNTVRLMLGYADNGVYLAAFALAFLGLLMRLRRKEDSAPSLLLTLLLCGYYAVHLIVEVQTRYRYFMMPCVFLLAGIALARVSGRHLKGENR